MPFLRFKGFDKPFLQAIAPVITEKFSGIAKIPEETVKIELINVERITDTPLSLEIFMFQRDKEEHDAIASAMHNVLKEYGFAHVHIFFIILEPSLYYKEGVPLKEPRNDF